MKLIATTLTATLISTAAMTTPMHSASRTAEAASSVEAEKLLDDIARTYRNAGALKDSLLMTVGQDTMQMDFRFDEDGNTQIRMPGGVITVIDDTMYIEDDLQPEKYLSVPIEEDIETTLKSIYGPETLLPYHFVMRANRGIEAYIESFTFGFFPQARLDGVRSVQLDNGEHRQEIRIISNDSEAIVHVHPQTKLVTRIELELPSPIGPDSDEKINVRVETDPKITDTLERKIAFDAGDREEVNDPAELTPEPLRPVRDGDPAPSFTLKTLDGKDVTLSDMQGKVVVLDFWATWCVPCIRAMPKLDSFAQWAEDEGLPIEVYAVNVWEHQATTPEQRKELASEFWSQQDYSTLTTLMDYDDSVILKFGYDSIPTTVIIGPDGKVFRTHIGFSMDMESKLRTDALAALEE